jgi:hypothetical protein
MTTVTATRVVPADPASTALLFAGASVLNFWPGISDVTGQFSPLFFRAELAGRGRHLVVRSQPPHRTPTAYVTQFWVDADGLPSARGTLRVTRQGWASDGDPIGSRSRSADVTAVSLELRTEIDYDEHVEQEVAAAVAAFLDNVASYASGLATVS